MKLAFRQGGDQMSGLIREFFAGFVGAAPPNEHPGRVTHPEEQDEQQRTDDPEWRRDEQISHRRKLPARDTARKLSC